MGERGGESGIQVRRIRADEVADFKAFRLRALADAPDAFSTTLAQAEAMPWSSWVDRVTRGAAGEESVLLVAEDAVTGAWLGITGSYVEPHQPETAHVVSVWTAPEARRRGVGLALLAAAREWARTRGMSEQRLFVSNTNDSARMLYERAGFRLTGRTEPYPNDPALHEQEMQAPV
ncbi:MAG: GNAT family N-acetyltransferase [Chloroflexi bacterium]|nr:GNAT family N-acetyltransferase [Chloroflexota bacterium]